MKIFILFDNTLLLPFLGNLFRIKGFAHEMIDKTQLVQGFSNYKMLLLGLIILLSVGLIFTISKNSSGPVKQ